MRRGETQDNFNPKTAKKIIQKAKSREKNRVRDLIHKVSRAIVNKFKGYRIIMEDLKGIRYHIKYGKKMNRRLHSWNFKLLQSFVDYKAKLNRSSIVYLNPRGTSKNCSRCRGIIAPKERFCPSCKLDRHINACINLLKMWGLQPTLTGSPMI
ncbi:MAG: IS200/IS605 family accessory protein TnpB-related protein [Nitrososphaerales archaeon]